MDRVEVMLVDNKFTRILYPNLLGKKLYWEVGLYENGYPIVTDGKSQFKVGRYEIEDLKGRKCYEIQFDKYDDNLVDKFIKMFKNLLTKE